MFGTLSGLIVIIACTGIEEKLKILLVHAKSTCGPYVVHVDLMCTKKVS